MADSDKLGSPQYDTSQPDHLADPRDGDNHLRDVKQRVYNWATREHNVDGKHKVPIGAGTPTPDATAYGQLAVKTGDGGYNELWCNVTGAFERLTSRGSIATLQTAVTVTLPAVDAALQAEIDALGIVVADLGGVVAGLGQKIVAQTPIVYTSDGSFSDPDAIFVLVEAWGGGGASNSTNSDNGSSGSGGGAYAASLILAIGLGTVIVDVAASVAAGVSGNNGNPSSFGTYVIAGGGTKGENAGAVGAGGVASFGASAKILSQVSISGGAGGLYGYKCGGGGGGCAGTNGTAGIGEFGPRASGGSGSTEGGAGGAGGYQVASFTTGLSGVAPGGGSGGCAGTTTATATGAEGRVRVTVYK